MNKLNKIFLSIIIVLVILLGIVSVMYLKQRTLLYEYLGNYNFSFSQIDNKITTTSNVKK